MIRFYDTNALLNLVDKAFEEEFIISSKTLEEIEHIKTSRNKDEEVKFNARQVARLIDKNQDKIKVIICNNEIYSALDSLRLDYSPDNIIMATASYYCNNVSPIVFVSDDINCKILAKNIFNLTVNGINEENNFTYKGFKEVLLSENDLAIFYENLRNNTYLCNVNEYLILKNENNEMQDVRRWTGEIYETVFNKNINSKLLGKIKPKDEFQKMAIDSMHNNTITMVRGSAGTGKTYLSLGFLFEQLESKKINKIIVLCNTMATLNSAKLGFLPGTKDEKLLDSSVGNMLMSKIGNKELVESLIEDGKLVLLPMCDIRGYDTTNMKAGVYISESQNMDISLMKLALQRIGKDCICIIDGDYNTQIDYSGFNGANNGMRRTSKVFHGEDIYGEVELQTIYRSQVAEIADRM